MAKDGNTLGITNIVRQVPTPTTVNGSIAVLRPVDMDSRYLRYVLASQLIQGMISAVRAGMGVPHLFQADIKILPLPNPPGEDQVAIADFLDAEVARIDALIKRKVLLIESIAARERILIEHRIVAMSQGVIPLRRLLVGPPQYGAAEAGDEGEEGWPRYIRITDLRADGSLRDDGVKRLRPERARPFLLHDGDLLFARSGATAGKAFPFRSKMGESCFAGYLIRFRISTALALPDFVELWTQTSHYWDQVAESSVQSTIQNVNADRYLGFLVPYVVRSRQPGLVDELNGMRRSHSRIRETLRRQIVLLRERRDAMITAAVTGELEIPGAAA